MQLPGEALADAAEAEDQDAAAAQRTGQAGQKRRQSRLSGQLGVFKGKGLVAGVIEPTQNPVADTVSRKTYMGADVDWYVKAEDIVLKNKGNQNAGNPQNPTPQGQPKK